MASCPHFLLLFVNTLTVKHGNSFHAALRASSSYAGSSRLSGDHRPGDEPDDQHRQERERELETSGTSAPPSPSIFIQPLVAWIFV
jgi:hypothetical protein